MTVGGKNGIINTEIDTLTPCLINRKTGKTVQTSVEQVHPKKNDFKEWEFDWSKPEKDGYSVYALKAADDNRIQGLVAIKAEPKMYSIKVEIVEAAPHNNTHNKNNISGVKEYDGVGGHIHFDAKNTLISHYQSTLGAEQIGLSQRMYINEKSAAKLIKKYYGGN